MFKEIRDFLIETTAACIAFDKIIFEDDKTFMKEVISMSKDWKIK